MGIVHEQIGRNEECIETYQSIPFDLMSEEYTTKNQIEDHLHRTKRSVEDIWRESDPKDGEQGE